MKKVLVCCIALLCIILYGCQTETLQIDETATTEKTTKDLETAQKGFGYNTSASQGNELVILYPEGTTEADKQALRNDFNVEQYKRCECADPYLELWIFSKGEAAGGGLEQKKESAGAREEIEGAEYNTNIKIQEDIFIDFAGIVGTDVGLTKRVTTNQGVTIAVLDTGIMYDYPGFTTPFLYNSDQDACVNNGESELFGWNFVEDNNNPYDNHYGRHGTIVTELIKSKMDPTNVNYQILPVKVANRFGDIRNFDALCGFKYAASKPDVSIINMSFGWYSEERELLKQFIDEVENEILVVTSAGNSGVNTDNTSHYPSSYDSENIIAVAGLGYGNSSSGNNPYSPSSVVSAFNPANGNNNSLLASFSNRGQVTVDIAAPGEHIPFAYNNEVIYIDGTSFSAAFVTGFMGSLFEPDMTASTMKATLLSDCIYNPNLYEIKYAKHIPH
ncbi:S8 family serine peptidase [uncultured Kordia sp.]|uniref:S8 family peptidase n=1 Tax=uncultured Kordia sp. TaxID=507699 RepID=UPI0026208E61|nr:S8 family serine peptidase [uncultured Kordia sp.]